MCGIAGLCRFDGTPMTVQALRQMTSAMAHRGPDGDGHYTDGRVGLAHRRLAILDLSPAASQPMRNVRGDLVITYNGEIFNSPDLREELRALGHQFVSHSDTEVLLHAFQEWGAACLPRLDGMFALALWNAGTRELLLARDRFGIKPLYYCLTADLLAFGSEIKALLAHELVAKRPCYEALHEYFTFQNVLTDRTLFDGIHMLPAGTWMSVNVETSAVKRAEYWNATFSEPVRISRPEAAEELHRIFTAAVTRHLLSDVEIGSYLSGGMDSGSVTAIARRQLGRLTTFTAGFDLSSASGLELGFDERANAEVLANELKTEHYEVVLHAGDMEHVMPRLIWHLEDLRVGQCYPNFYVARLAGKFVKVVLSGAGGDELFGGYPWRYAYAATARTQSDFLSSYYTFWQRLVPDGEKADLFTAETYDRGRAHVPFEVFRDIMLRGPAGTARPSACDLVNGALYFELKTFLHGLLVVEDKVSMAHGLETRVPFLDNELVDFALRLPVEFKLRTLEPGGGRSISENDVNKNSREAMRSSDGKVLLREAMSKIIPAAVTERAKQGFSAPDASWFRGESIDYINKLLRDRRARLYDFIQPQYVTRVLDEHTSGRQNRRLLIWSFLSFEWWLRAFFP